MKRFIKLLGLGAAVALLTIGCGGGGSGSGGSVRATAFITDNARDGYDEVWVSIYKVELIDTADGSTSIYDESAGRLVNLRRLTDGVNSRYSFLGEFNVDGSKQFDSVRVTLGKVAKLGLDTSSSVLNYNLIGTAVPGDANKVTVLFNLNSIRNIDSGEDISIDFDLANFTLSGSNCTPSIREGNGNGLDDDSKHEVDEVEGTISNLSGTSPTFTFNIAKEGRPSLRVVTSASTAIFNQGSTASPTLANGKRVEVHGQFDPVNDRFEASRVKIKTNESDSEDPHEARVFWTAYNETAGTFTVNVIVPEDFAPNSQQMNVTTNGGTLWRLNNGTFVSKTAFFDAISMFKGGLLELDGTYNADTNTFAARKVKLENEGNDDGEGGGVGEAEAYGTTSNRNATAGTFRLTLTEWDGFSPSGNAVNVRPASSGVQYKNAANDNVTRAQWFALLGDSTSVKVEGSMSDGVLVAREFKLRSPD
jgi:hypothetical protein